MPEKIHDEAPTAVQVADLNDGILSEVQRNESHVAGAIVKDDEPPDGGLQAWLQVFGSFCLYWNTW